MTSVQCLHQPLDLWEMASLDVETCTLFCVIVYSGPLFLNEEPGAEARLSNITFWKNLHYYCILVTLELN